MKLPIAPPAWLRSDDPLAAAHEQYPHLLERGHVVLGNVVMANEAIFREDAYGCPAVVVHPRDPALAVEVDELQRVARSIFASRKTEPGDAHQAELARILRVETERFFSMPVPPALSRARPLFVSCVMLYAPHLPVRRLITHFLPLLVCEDRPEVAMLPAHYWAPDLRDAWQDVGAM